MDHLDGLISLFIACLELVLLLNLLIFAEKISVNKLVILLVFLLMGYQFYEFAICYFGVKSSVVVYLAILDITLLPPLSLMISLRMLHGRKNWHKFVFIPALFFIFYFPTVVTDFTVAKCTVLYATFNYPLGDLYGVFYYLPVLITIIILYLIYSREQNRDKKNLSLVMLISFSITFIPAAILFLTTDFLIGIKESILCKIALLLAFGSTFFALKNKSVFGEE